MKELKNLINNKEYLKAKTCIVENKEKIDQIADCLLEYIERLDEYKRINDIDPREYEKEYHQRDFGDKRKTVMMQTPLCKNDNFESVARRAYDFVNAKPPTKQNMIDQIEMLEGVKSCEIIPSGLAGFECIVDGGGDQDIASCIHDNKMVISRSIGTISNEVKLFDGGIIQERFSRPGNTLSGKKVYNAEDYKLVISGHDGQKTEIKGFNTNEEFKVNTTQNLTIDTDVKSSKEKDRLISEKLNKILNQLNIVPE